jgi:nicotinamide-nucleotide amidase
VQRKTIAIAESCTGGLIADRLTNVPGSSAYVERGAVTYSNASKVQLLNVDPGVIEKFGAVSRETAEAMAAGIRKTSGADIGISTTGIAGPSGGSVEKPVGLVWIGYADRDAVFALRFHFGNDRRRVKERASQAALELVRRTLSGIETEPS